MHLSDGLHPSSDGLQPNSNGLHLIFLLFEVSSPLPEQRLPGGSVAPHAGGGLLEAKESRPWPVDRFPPSMNVVILRLTSQMNTQLESLSSLPSRLSVMLG